MKYTAPQYARALLSLVAEAPERKERETMRSFFKTLAAHGALSLMPEIVRAASDIRRRKKNLKHVSVRAAARGGAVVESEGLRVDNSIAMRLKRLQEALCA